jgi:DNA-binding NtrC family response regulator
VGIGEEHVIVERIRVLFVDDEEHILTSLRRTFGREGYELFFTSDPVSAAPLVIDQGIDIVVSDYRMPDMTGVELLSKLRRVAPRTVRILMTGEADREATIRAINDGSVFRFVEKPFQVSLMREVVREASRLVLAERASAPNAAKAVKSFGRIHPSRSS